MLYVSYAIIHLQNNCGGMKYYWIQYQVELRFLLESINLLMCHLPIMSLHQIKLQIKMYFGIEGN